VRFIGQLVHRDAGYALARAAAARGEEVIVVAARRAARSGRPKVRVVRRERHEAVLDAAAGADCTW